MNAIKQLKMNMQARVQYTIPADGSFLVMWVYRGIPFSGTYQWRNGELAVYVDGIGWELAGVGAAEDYYNFDQLKQIASSEVHAVTQFIAVVVVEVAE